MVNAEATAAAAPTTAPIEGLSFFAAQTVAPTSAPDPIRANSEGNDVRAGMKGSLSATISPAARIRKTAAALGEASRLSSSPSAAPSLVERWWLSRAGADMVRMPETAPSPAA
jgi:hypothetical protein